MSDLNSIQLSPDFNPHRMDVSATSGADVTDRRQGVNARGMSEAIISLSIVSGTLSSCVIEMMYWSDAAGKFLLEQPTEELTFSVAGQAIAEVHGRVFFCRCKTLTGVAPHVRFDVAGIADDSGQ